MNEQQNKKFDKLSERYENHFYFLTKKELRKRCTNDSKFYET